MEGKELNALPKVTTLSDGDTLLAIDSGGGGKRISRDALVNQDVAREYISSTSNKGWITVAKVESPEIFGGILHVTSGGWSGTPNYHVFAIGVRYANQAYTRPVVKALTGITSNIKMRIIQTENVGFRIDVHESYRKIFVKADGGITLGDLAFDAAIPEGSTVWEYDFSASESGGVMLSLSNGCNLFVTPKKGGGQRDGRKDYNRGDAEVVIADADSVFARDCSERKPEQYFGAGTVLLGSENTDRHSDDKQVWSTYCAASGKRSDIAVCDFGWYGIGISDEDWRQSNIVAEGHDNYHVANRKEVAA